MLEKPGIAIPISFQVVECRNCHHHYVDPRVRDEDLGQIYGDDYYRGRGFDPSVDFYAAPGTTLSPMIEKIITMLAKAARRPVAELKWLDYGCGAGNLMTAVRLRGGEPLGYDLGETAKKLCSEKGLDLLDEFALNTNRETFDVVTAIEVIEHVGNPRQFLRQLASLLKVGGILYVQTGNWNIVRHVPGQPYIMPEGHLQYFTPTTMRKLFKEVGLEEVEVANVSWAGYKIVSKMPINLSGVVRLVERGIRATAPGYSQFPIGIRKR